MGDIAMNRGPDDEGLHDDDAFLLAMRRLSIIDLAGGHGPDARKPGEAASELRELAHPQRELALA